jgi:membrane protease YdiL (CAAX protease family)
MDEGRKVEFGALYLGAPLVMALAMPPDWLWPVFWGVTLAAVVLLARTPGFDWRELARGGVAWGEVALVAAVTAAAAGALVWLLVPGQAFALPRRAPGLWVGIMLLYPLLSALPQELVFRALFFRRYGGLFEGRELAVAVNALGFALAHLMFWNWVAAALTVAGGVVFARGYLRRGFLQAVVLHAVAGGIIFTSGLGVFFYHGAVGR